MTSGASTTQITDHRAFRPAVALWFAALLGLGFFVMPESIHTTLAGMLGFGGRAMFAGIAAALGLVAGYLLAGRIIANNALPTSGAEDDMPRRSASGDPARTRASSTSLVGEEEQPPRNRVFNPREEIDAPGIAAATTTAPFTIPAFDDSEEDIDGLIAIDDADAYERYDPEFSSRDGDDPLMHVWRNDSDFEIDASQAPPFSLPSAKDSGSNEDPVIRHDNTAYTAAPAPFIAPTVSSAETAADNSIAERAMEEGSSTRGDLSLGELTERLAGALAAHKQRVQDNPPAEHSDTASGNGNARHAADPARPIDDPVVAFLRRETHRNTAARATDIPSAQPLQIDPQATLRDALDRLSRAKQP